MNQCDWIVLSEMSFPCVLGLYDWERQNPQTLVVEVGMALDLNAAASGDLAASVDYGRMLGQLEFIARKGQWHLLESMVAAMARHVLASPAPGEQRAQVERVRIRLAKPEIFGGRAVPSVEIVRERSWRARRRFVPSVHDGVAVEILEETHDTGAYHVSLVKGAVWPLPDGSTVQAIAGRVRLNDRQLVPGECHGGPGTIHVEQDQPARVLVVSPRHATRDGAARV